MSKYLGKLLLESGSVSESCLESVLVHYVKNKDAFCFRYEGIGTGGVFYAGAELVFGLCSFTGYLDCQYQWSVGYTVRPLKGLESLRSMREEELWLLGGRRKLVTDGLLDSDDSFDMLCAIQYLFKFSGSFFERVKRHYKRERSYIAMDRRKLGNSGRKKGSKNVVCEDEEKESVSDIISRCAHNKRIAIQRGILGWYIEACKEEAKALGQKFNKDQCLNKWQEMRKNEGL